MRASLPQAQIIVLANLNIDAAHSISALKSLHLREHIPSRCFTRDASCWPQPQAPLSRGPLTLLALRSAHDHICQGMPLPQRSCRIACLWPAWSPSLATLDHHRVNTNRNRKVEITVKKKFIKFPMRSPSHCTLLYGLLRKSNLPLFSWSVA